MPHHQNWDADAVFRIPDMTPFCKTGGVGLPKLAANRAETAGPRITSPAVDARS